RTSARPALSAVWPPDRGRQRAAADARLPAVPPTPPPDPPPHARPSTTPPVAPPAPLCPRRPPGTRPVDAPPLPGCERGADRDGRAPPDARQAARGATATSWLRAESRPRAPARTA